ncbi:MAG: type II toxin-antitoxin system HipA family toxin [Sphingomonas sp.]
MTPWKHIQLVNARLDFGSDGHLEMGAILQAPGVTVFRYHSEFINDQTMEPSPIILPRNDVDYVGNANLGAPLTVFADSQPETWARRILDDRLIAEGYDPTTLTALDRLALVGENGVGALTYHPAHPRTDIIPSLNGASIRDVVMGTDNDITRRRILEAMGGSLGGARPKVTAFSEGTKINSREQPAMTPWILKLPGSFDRPDKGAEEYAYAQMAGEAGIVMPRTLLHTNPDGPGDFAVERFDRDRGRRLHYHSYAGLCGLALEAPSSYTSLFETAKRLTGLEDIQHIRRMAFNVMAVNRDDHVKNHGFLMDREGRWVTAPAFDLTFEPLKAHSLDVGGRRVGITVADMERAVSSAGWDPAPVKEIVNEVRHAVRNWRGHARKAEVANDRIDQIEKAIAEADPPEGRRRIVQVDRGMGF